MSEKDTEKTLTAFQDESAYNTNISEKLQSPRKDRKVLVVAIIAASLIVVVGIIIAIVALSGNVTAAEIQDAKDSFVPPAEIISIDTTQADPSNDQISFTYDSRTRIVSCTYTANSKSYKQNYSYDDSAKEVTIKTVYKTYVIKEKVIEYVEVPNADTFKIIDGYYVRLDEESFEDAITTQESSSTQARETTTQEKTAKQETGNQNLVETAKEITASFQSGGTVNFRIPKVLLNSNDAKSVNTEILQKYQEYFDGNTHGCVQLDYVYYTYNGMLSVIVGAQYEGGGSVAYSIYTFDIQTEKLLNNNDLRNRFSISDAKVVEKIRTAEDNHFGDMFDYTWPDNIMSIYDEAYDLTVENSNLSDYTLFVGTKGLMAEINEYQMAGAGATRVTIDLENDRVFYYFYELQEEY